MAILLFMMFLTVGDVIARYFFNKPVPGTFELTNLMLPLLVFFGLAYTQVRKGHISIDIVISRFPARVRAIADSISSFLSLSLFALVVWQSAVYAHRLWQGHIVSGVLAWPVYPFLIAAAFGSLLFCFVLLGNLLDSLAKAVKREP